MTGSAYDALHARFNRLGTIEEALAILSWDYATMMPKGGANARGEQMSVLQVIAHQQLTAPDLEDLFGRAAMEGGRDVWAEANLAAMNRQWRKAIAVPADLVAALAKATLECEMIWRQARPDNDYPAVRPALSELLNLTLQAGQAKADAFGLGLYDALLDDYEPGGRSAHIDTLFAELAGFLPDLINTAIEHQAKEPAPIQPQGPFPIVRQRELADRMMRALGFDFGHGRLDVSAHPFSGGIPDDVRITTRYEEGLFSRSLMGVLHETGHALYEQGLPAAWRRQPVGVARGMSMHESQSLMVEMQACRSAEFMQFLAPVAREVFGGEGAAWEPENLHRLETRVRRGLIRVDADEVTYPAHVVLRYRLERAIIQGELGLDDLPGAWRDGMKELVGSVPETDREGCLQDIHWYSGSWGYFPTYTLGAMTAAQLFDAAKRAVPSIPGDLAKGDFSNLLGWLRTHIHGRASSVPGEVIVKEATGAPLGTSVFRQHLERRYLGRT
ncbi:MAG TPA: carboxypeptidase M32 [Stellaceae bacterium]|nr:carboxypeptidase M32 [Stellaceae bacterium]